MKSSTAVVLVLIILMLFSFYLAAKQPAKPVQISISPTPTPLSQASPSPIKSQLGAGTKTIDCHVQGPLPDPECTPGATDPTLTKDVLCSKSFSTKSVRNVPESTKNQVYASYGITSHSPGQYEVDHMISLELGGSNDISNLFPEAAEPRPGFHEKDIVENYLHDQVCAGAISLQQAQQEIAQNWLQVYQARIQTK